MNPHKFVGNKKGCCYDATQFRAWIPARFRPMDKQLSFDYIIAGAGSAGCVLAARLCEDPTVTVCLVEAGGNGDSLFVRMPAGNGFLFGNARFDWGYCSVAQPGLDGRRIYYPRGKGLGGTSLMNGLIYVRGNARDFDRWRDLGIRGWGYADVLPYFKKSETATHRDPAFHGHSGPLKVTPALNYCEVSRGFVAGPRVQRAFDRTHQVDDAAAAVLGKMHPRML